MAKGFTKLRKGLWMDNATGQIGYLQPTTTGGYYVEDITDIKGKLKREDIAKAKLKLNLKGHKEAYRELSKQAERSAYGGSADYYADRIRNANQKLAYAERKLKEYDNPREYKGDLGKVAGKHVDRIDTTSLDTKALDDKQFTDRVINEQRKIKTEQAVDRVYKRSFKELQKEYDRISDENRVRMLGEINKGDAYINEYGTTAEITNISKNGETTYKITSATTGLANYQTYSKDSVQSMLAQNGYKKLDKTVPLKDAYEKAGNKYATNNGSGSDDNTSAYADKAIKYWEKQREDTIARGGDTSWEDDSIKKWQTEKANRLYGEMLNDDTIRVSDKYLNPSGNSLKIKAKNIDNQFIVVEAGNEYKASEDELRSILKEGKYEKNEVSGYKKQDTSPMSEYSDTTGTGYSDKQYKELQSGAYDKRTSTELRKQLKALEPYTQELQVGDRVIVNTGGGRYGVRNKDDFDDPMTDYSAYVYGFNAKSIIERAREQGIITDKPKISTEAKIERFKQRKQGATIDTMSKRELAEKIVENQIARGMSFTNKEEIIKDKMRMSKSDLLKYFK